MNLVHKLIYLRRLYGYDSTNDKQKQMIDKKIISHLSKESWLYNKQSNAQQLSSLSLKIESSINLLQNPNNCSDARIMVCSIDPPGWGFGHLMHMISYCFIFAIESGRTMIFNNENTKIFKFDVRWNELFKSNSNCSYEEHVKPFLPIKEFLEKEQSDRITIFYYKPDFYSRGFDVAPLEIKEFILKYHSNPILWFRSQLLKYIWRENDEILNLTNQLVSKIPFECGPVVGIHVRKTDKITESKIQKLEDYMKWVDFWFEVNEENYQNNPINNSNNCTNKRMLFVAADLPVLENVAEEVKNKWGNKYEIYHGTIFKNETQYSSKEAFIEILAVYRILAKCQFLVCTFSSNTCEIIYELMQAFQGDASENVHSLDYLYSQFWMALEMEAITDYKPTHEYPVTPEELWAEKGDVILAISPIHQDGFIRGRNVRLNTEGNFPSYLLKKHLKYENFSIFANILQ